MTPASSTSTSTAPISRARARLHGRVRARRRSAYCPALRSARYGVRARPRVVGCVDPRRCERVRRRGDRPARVARAGSGRCTAGVVPQCGSQRVGIGVPDLDAAVDRIGRLGGRVWSEPTAHACRTEVTCASSWPTIPTGPRSNASRVRPHGCRSSRCAARISSTRLRSTVRSGSRNGHVSRPTPRTRRTCTFPGRWEWTRSCSRRPAEERCGSSSSDSASRCAAACRLAPPTPSGCGAPRCWWEISTPRGRARGVADRDARADCGDADGPGSPRVAFRVLPRPGPRSDRAHRTAPVNEFPGDFFARQDEADDARFYDFPRFVTHIDDAAIPRSVRCTKSSSCGAPSSIS